MHPLATVNILSVSCLALVLDGALSREVKERLFEIRLSSREFRTFLLARKMKVDGAAHSRWKYPFPDGRY